MDFVEPDTEIALNIGGQLFETNAAILTRDPFSILAALCRQNPPIARQADGTFFFDRDWWIFRHIIAYLRSDVLPTELETLKELYLEAQFYRIQIVQKAIESLPMDHMSLTQSV